MSLNRIGKSSQPFSLPDPKKKGELPRIIDSQKDKAVRKRRRVMNFTKGTFAVAFACSLLITYIVVKDDLEMVKEAIEARDSDTSNIQIGLQRYASPPECADLEKFYYRCHIENKKRVDQCLNQSLQYYSCISTNSSLTDLAKPFKIIAKDSYLTPTVLEHGNFEHAFDKYNPNINGTTVIAKATRELYTKAIHTKNDVIAKVKAASQ